MSTPLTSSDLNSWVPVLRTVDCQVFVILLLCDFWSYVWVWWCTLVSRQRRVGWSKQWTAAVPIVFPTTDCWCWSTARVFHSPTWTGIWNGVHSSYKATDVSLCFCNQ